MKNKSTIDLIEYSDLFRRAAAADTDPVMEMFVEKARDLAVESTHVYGEYSVEHIVNKSSLERIDRILNEIAEVAAAHGVREVILPFGGGVYNTNVKYIQIGLLDKKDYPVTFSFQDNEYTTDLSGEGLIDRDIRTLLDEGLIGLSYISEETKRAWKWETKRGDNFCLEF